MEEESSEGQEGATEFVDMEAEGFDEGQGTENVSKDNQDLKELVRCYKYVLYKSTESTDTL